MNSTDPTWRDRFGVEKPTIDAALKSAGFMPAGFDFVTGGTLQPGDRNKAVYNPAPNGDNNWYRWNGVFPKEIAANSQPNPKDENNWVPVIIKTGVVEREALRRTYLEVGLNLVEGSFEQGAVITSTTDVVLHEKTGKCYSGTGPFPQNVSGSTNPESPDFTDQSRKLLRVPFSGYYSSITHAIADPRNLKRELLLDAGTFSEGVTTGNCDLKGSGYETILQEGVGGFALKLLRSTPDWERREIKNLRLSGKSTVGTVGVLYDPADPFAGRWDLSYIGITGFEIGISKPQGNIGNTNKAVNFRSMPYGFKAKDGTISTMHTGVERFDDCTWGDINTWCVDIECKTDGGGGIIIENSIMEKCVGGGIRLDCGNRTAYTPITFKNLWFEQIASAESVTRDGVVEIPRQIKMIDTPIAFAEECYLSNIELINSKLVAARCRTDNISSNIYNMIIDDASSLILVDVYANGPIGGRPLVKSICSQKWPVGNRNMSMRGLPPSSRIAKAPGGVIKAKESYTGTVGTTTWSFPGSTSATATCVADGTISANCAELNIAAGNTQQSLLEGAIVPGKWYVWGVDANLVSGEGTFLFTNTATLGEIYIEPGKWISTFGIGKANVSGKARLYMTAITNVKIKVQNYFIVEFDKEEDALAFCNSRLAIT